MGGKKRSLKPTSQRQVPSLRSLCEPLVSKIRELEVKHRNIMYRASVMVLQPDRLYESFRERDFAEAEIAAGRTPTTYLRTLKTIYADIEERNLKWCARLNTWRLPSRATNRFRWFPTRFDLNGSLFNLAFRTIIKNLQEEVDDPHSKYVLFIVRTSGPFFDFICKANMPRIFRNELLEWHCLNIMYDRYEEYYDHVQSNESWYCCYRLDTDRSRHWHYLADILRIFKSGSQRYKGLKYCVDNPTTGSSYVYI